MGYFIKNLASPQFLTQDGYGYRSIGLLTITSPTTALNLNSGDLYKGVMPDGNVTLSITNPRVGAFRLVVMHNTVEHTLTFPTGYFAGDTFQTAHVYTLVAGAALITAFDLYYDGTDWYFSPLPFIIP